MSAPDGERVTTGSEPRRLVLYRDVIAGREGAWLVADGFRPTPDGTREVIELKVVEPGHDEQTEDDALGAIRRLSAATERLQHIEREWQEELAAERERTVAAVVEELDRAGAYIPSGRTFEAGRYIENHPRFKPSAPGGDDGH